MTPAEHPAQLIRRQVGPLVEECVRDFRVTIVNGPRQAGKTTLLRHLHATLGGTFATLDDADQRSAARDDPAGYLQAGPRPLFIDEVQRAGDDFVIAIKAAVDRDPRPGTFVLSGSTRFLTVPTPMWFRSYRTGQTPSEDSSHRHRSRGLAHGAER